jgi:hypothetical protein
MVVRLGGKGLEVVREQRTGKVDATGCWERFLLCVRRWNG